MAFAAVTTACGELFSLQVRQKIERPAERLGLVLQQIAAIEAARHATVCVGALVRRTAATAFVASADRR